MRRTFLIILLIIVCLTAIGQDAKFFKRGSEKYIISNNIEFRICQSEKNTVSLHYIINDSIHRKTSSITIPPVIKYENVDYIVKYIDVSGIYSNFKLYLPNTIEAIGIPPYSKGNKRTIPRLVSTKYMKAKPWTLQIPSSVSDINPKALEYLAIKYIEVETGNKKYCSIDGILYNKEVTQLIFVPQYYRKHIEFPPGIKKIGRYAFYFSKSVKTLEIPCTVNAIEERAFSHSNIKRIRLSSSIDSIGEDAFAGCKIKEINIPNSVKCFGRSIFYGCNSLKKVNLPSSIKTIPSYFFEACVNLKSIELPNGIESIEHKAFYGCIKLKEIDLPDSLLVIDEEAFSFCSKLTIINIPDMVQFVGQDAFSECSSLEEINLPQTFENTERDWFKHLEMRYPCCGDDTTEFSAPVFLIKNPTSDFVNEVLNGYGDIIYVPSGSEEIYRKIYSKVFYDNVGKVKTIGE